MRGLLLAGSCAALIASAGTVFAGGFNIYEMGTRATALGGAFTATADDPTAIFYNPAAMSFNAEGWAASINISPTLPSTKFARAIGVTELVFPGDATGETTDKKFFPSGAYLTYRPGPQWAFGFGVFTPFGLGVQWDEEDTFAGRPISHDSSLEGFYFSPVVSYAPTSQISFGFGLNLVKTKLELNRITPMFLGTDNTRYDAVAVKMTGTSSLGTSIAGGIMIKPGDGKLQFGINYKGKVINEFDDGEAEFEVLDVGDDVLEAAVQSGLDARGDQAITSELPFPAILSVGARHQTTDDLALMVDFVWFGWSEFEELTLSFTDTTLNTTLREDYSDGQQWRFGAEYQITPALRGMAGFVVDNSPQPSGSVSPLLPDANRLDYSCGVTYTTGSMDLSLGYMLVDFEERSTVVGETGQAFEGFDGAYKTVVHIPSFGATFHF